LNKVVEEKKTEGLKEEQGDAEKNQENINSNIHLFPHKPTNYFLKVRLH
jgi:hypothetical protein